MQLIDYLVGTVLPLSRARHGSPAAFAAPLEPRAGQHVSPELQPLLALAADHLWRLSQRCLTSERQNILTLIRISEVLELPCNLVINQCLTRQSI